MAVVAVVQICHILKRSWFKLPRYLPTLPSTENCGMTGGYQRRAHSVLMRCMWGSPSLYKHSAVRRPFRDAQLSRQLCCLLVVADYEETEKMVGVQVLKDASSAVSNGNGVGKRSLVWCDPSRELHSPVGAPFSNDVTHDASGG